VKKLTTFEGPPGPIVKSLLLQATRCAVGVVSEIIGGVRVIPRRATETRVAVADHRSIGAEVRQRNSHKPSQQGSFTKIGQGIQKGGYAPSLCFDQMAKPPQLTQLEDGGHDVTWKE
jgi:hypothetical protein